MISRPILNLVVDRSSIFLYRHDIQNEELPNEISLFVYDSRLGRFILRSLAVMKHWTDGLGSNCAVVGRKRNDFYTKIFYTNYEYLVNGRIATLGWRYTKIATDSIKAVLPLRTSKIVHILSK